MKSILVRLMLLAALVQLGISLATFRDCRGRECFALMDKAIRDVSRVDWRPISVFPEEGKRFR